MTRHELRLPDLDMGDCPLVASIWLVDVGGEVTEGDRVLEVLAGAATVDLPSPAGGILVEQCVEEEDAITTGQLLAIIESPEEANE